MQWYAALMELKVEKAVSEGMRNELKPFFKDTVQMCKMERTQPVSIGSDAKFEYLDEMTRAILKRLVEAVAYVRSKLWDMEAGEVVRGEWVGEGVMLFVEG